MHDALYAVHTRTCTYVLDVEGICRWVEAKAGPPAEDACVGAQFVACLDFRVEGGLVGELVAGASALFVRNEKGRLVLLRTKPIEYVEFRRPVGLPDPQTGSLSDASEEEHFLDMEDLATYSSEVTTLMPLYRPEVLEVDARPPAARVPGRPGSDGSNRR